MGTDLRAQGHHRSSRDPFAGSGTVGQVALSLCRKFVGVEISSEYTDMANRRVMGPLFA